MKEALYYQKMKDGRIQCLLCPHECSLNEGKGGICGARENSGDKLVSLNYETASAISMDPVEKKPLYHYYPGEQILSLGTLGCNFICQFCQNHHLSRYYDKPYPIQGHQVQPDDVIRSLHESGSFGVAYTYSEPIVWYEFVLETSKLVRDNGGKNVLVTNGFINPAPLRELLPYIDAVNIDLKAFTDENYRKLGGRLNPVLDTITAMKKAGIHVEITTLIVPRLNDNFEELESLFKWIAALDTAIPYHISRYSPQYKYLEPPTEIDTLEKAAGIASEYLKYVYIGNIIADNDTYCPDCHELQIKRVGYSTEINGLKCDGSRVLCAHCGHEANFVLGKGCM